MSNDERSPDNPGENNSAPAPPPPAAAVPEAKAQEGPAARPDLFSPRAPRFPWGAWQPLTPRGIASFATASNNRLIFVQAMVAVLASAATVWFVSTRWSPTILEAIRQLPNAGVIRNQELNLAGTAPITLAESPFLAIIVHPRPGGGMSSGADLRLEFGRDQVGSCSLFGCARWRYPAGWEIQFNRPELEPWWGAWQPLLLAALALGTFFGLLLTWFVLALLGFPLVLLLAYFNDRPLTIGGSWRLVGAALMPGALLLVSGIVSYGLAALDLVLLGLIVVAHLLVDGVWLVLSVFALPLPAKVSGAPGNPFETPDPPDKSDPLLP